MSEPVGIAQVQTILERLLRDGAIDKGQQEVYLSKYSKAWELLSQALANEKVHAHNINDLQTELTKIDEITQHVSHQQAGVSQNIFKVRQ